MATAVLIGWVFDGARGSVLLAALFHASADVSIGLSGVMTAGVVPLWTFVGLQIAAAVVAGWRLWSTDRQAGADGGTPWVAD